MGDDVLRWTPFHQIDDLRRWQGIVLDLVGLGPLTSRSRIAFAESGVTLQAFAEPSNDKPVLLLVPAPVKRSYLWDLVPWASVVQQCLRARLQVYLIEWDRPGPDQQGLGLSDYADRLIHDCLRAVERETGHSRAFLAGHSLGGTLAAIFAALRPERVQGLILLGAPLHFGPNVGDLDRLAAASPRAELATAVLGNVPGSFLDLNASVASPTTFALDRWNDWLQSLSDAWALQTHLRVERWTLDEAPVAKRLFEEVSQWLYREDRLMEGRLLLDGRPVAPEAVVAPLLTVADPRCRIVPPDASLPFHEATRSSDKRLYWYQRDTGVALYHLGMLVGRSAHEELWPQIVG